MRQPILDDPVDEEPDVFDRIAVRPDLLGGKPCIAGTRISVQFVLERLASGESVAEIVRTYPHLNDAEVRQAILFAASHMSAAAFPAKRTAE